MNEWKKSMTMRLASALETSRGKRGQGATAGSAYAARRKKRKRRGSEIRTWTE